MRKDHESNRSRPAWLSMLGVLRTCLSCGALLTVTKTSVTGFCRECLDQSRDVSNDNLGGEA